MNEAETSVRHWFTDPISQEPVALVITGPDPSFWDETIGVDHPRCETLANVSPDYDAFYCQACKWNGRISGAWAFDMAKAARAAARAGEGGS